jgi:hypothetical protein
MPRLLFALLALALLAPAAHATDARDLSDIRGFNYTPASVDHYQLWTQYNAAEVDRDFGYAVQLKLNMARVFVRYADWQADPAKFRANFDSFFRIADKHHIRIMLVFSPVAEAIDNFTGAQQVAQDARLDAWAKAIIAMARGKKAIRFWDVANEPDLPSRGPANVAHRMAFARRMANLVHAADKTWLTTVGCTFEPCMEELEPYTDILSYHDYSPTAERIKAEIAKAQAFARKVGKPVINTEIGCIGRANPYDVALREYMRARMGFFIWELMISSFWGDVHGVFYPDGTVRDPAIPAALMGWFRNDGANVVRENPDREEWVSRPLARAKTWLADPQGDWAGGLEIAEIQANMLQGAQLIAMREPPVRTVKLLRSAPPDREKLRQLLTQWSGILANYARAPR